MTKTPLFLTSWNSWLDTHVYPDTYLFIHTDINIRYIGILTLFLASKFQEGRNSGGFITVSPR